MFSGQLPVYQNWILLPAALVSLGALGALGAGAFLRFAPFVSF